MPRSQISAIFVNKFGKILSSLVRVGPDMINIYKTNLQFRIKV